MTDSEWNETDEVEGGFPRGGGCEEEGEVDLDAEVRGESFPPTVRTSPCIKI